MTEKKRVKACIKFRQTDKVPWQIDCTSERADCLLKELGLKERSHVVRGKSILKYQELEDYFGNHMCNIRSTAVDSFNEVKRFVYRDEWGVLWDRQIDKDIGTPLTVILNAASLKNLRVPDPFDPARFAHIEPLIRANKNRYILVKISRCLFERAWSLRGMENLLTDFILNPAFVHELFSAITDFALDLLRGLKQFAIDGIRFSDDWGGQRGLLMSPQMWRKFIKPYMKKMYRQAHAQGCDVFIHTCGDVSVLLDDLIEIGADVFNPLQPEVMDVSRTIELYAGKLAFNGGLSIQRTLPFGSPEEVMEETNARLKLGQTYGGYIISPAHDMPPDIPLRNIKAMLEVLKAQR